MQNTSTMTTSKPKHSARFGLPLAAALMLLSPSVQAGPAEEANAALDLFSAAYTSNDVEAVVALYAPDAILLGTNSPIITTGKDEVRTYFKGVNLAGSGNKNVIHDRRTIVVNENAVLVTGFYEFIRMKDGQPVPGPARFTVLMTKRDGRWVIAHQHSSPRAMPKN
jgi:uncharacterized protein (TIGR02246 family)